MAEKLTASQEETCCTELANSKSNINLDIPCLSTANRAVLLKQFY
jgi:hypothetical protein